MTNTIDTVTIKSLRAIADARHSDGSLQQHEKCIAFYNLCTAALNGEAWAIERVADAARRAEHTHSTDAAVLRAILATDTSRP